jgi:hypothetical protein
MQKHKIGKKRPPCYRCLSADSFHPEPPLLWLSPAPGGLKRIHNQAGVDPAYECVAEQKQLDNEDRLTTQRLKAKV